MVEEGEEINEMRKKRYEQLARAQEMEAQKRTLVRNLVDSAGYERLMNVRLANPELYDQLVGTIAYLYKNGQVKGKLSEAQVIQLLSRLRGSVREPTITVRRKE